MSSDVNDRSESTGTEDAAKSPRRILIGSQKDPAAYRPRRDWAPVEEETAEQENKGAAEQENQTAAAPPLAPAPAAAATIAPPATIDVPAPPVATPPPEAPAAPVTDVVAEPAAEAALSRYGALDFEEELSQELDDHDLDALLAGDEALSKQPTLELDSQQMGRVLAVHHDNVFIELGGREQGVLSLRQLAAPPELGTTLQVSVRRFNADDGLYELSLPHTASSVADWGDLSEGMVVEARVTGHNAGGLECEVNHIRGFIPISQVSLYRVENLAEFVDEHFTCLVTEANPERRNLVLSRRAMLEREREESRQQLLATLEPGQVHEGVVRKLMDFGAFVDIGGVDGLLHVSQLSWARVKHPSDVLQEGQTIKVRINKIDPDTHKISLGYRDMLENPWSQAVAKYPPNSVVHGKVTKLMEFGAFVELEPGIEGLVHISELSPKRVWRVSEVVNADQEVDVLVLSVDAEAQRISLSMRALLKDPEPVKTEEEPAEAPPPPPASKKPSLPLKGGLGASAGGDKFGLKW